MLEATISATPAIQESVNWLSIINQYVPYITLGGVISGLIGFGISVGSFKSRFTNLEKQFTTFEGKVEKKFELVLSCVESLNECVNEIQTVLKAKLKDVEFDKKTMSTYGKSNSPMVLRDEFRPLVKESGLEAEVKKNKSRLVKWLKAQKPKTGLDAQDEIINLVASQEIEKYLSLDEYKQYIYKEGKLTQDAKVILAIYLFEQIIPEVIPD
jgi:hypothetical protein